MLERVREQWLAAPASCSRCSRSPRGDPAGGEPTAAVLALRHAVPAGGIVRSADVVAVPIAASDRTPSMLEGLGGLAGRRTSIALAGGDFLVRGALRGGDAVGAPPARRACARARALARRRARPGAAAGRAHRRRRGRRSRGPRIAARGLELLSPASERSGGVVVTLRAPMAVALSLAAPGRPRSAAAPARGRDVIVRLALLGGDAALDDELRAALA